MKINFRCLDHVQIVLPTNSEDDARRFYSELLGLEEIEKPDSLKPSGGVWFKIGDVELHLGIEENIVKTKSHPAFEIKNIDDAKEYLIQNNVKIKEEIQIPGRKRFSFYDPFGNRIELLEFN